MPRQPRTHSSMLHHVTHGRHGSRVTRVTVTCILTRTGELESFSEAILPESPASGTLTASLRQVACHSNRPDRISQIRRCLASMSHSYNYTTMRQHCTLLAVALMCAPRSLNPRPQRQLHMHCQYGRMHSLTHMSAVCGVARSSRLGSSSAHRVLFGPNSCMYSAAALGKLVLLGLSGARLSVLSSASYHA